MLCIFTHKVIFFEERRNLAEYIHAEQEPFPFVERRNTRRGYILFFLLFP